jgi:NADPH:quinone reductase-like Zn-dependent oxidoreductase
MANLARMWRYQPQDHAYRLELAAEPWKALGPTEVRVQVKATSLNYRDLIARDNKAGRPVQGRIPLSDGAGEVIEVGAEVELWRPGDRVAACFFPRWQGGPFALEHHKHDLGGNLDGMLATQVAMDQQAWVAIPSHLSYEEAACLPCAAVTAWQALFARGQLKAGETVLTLGTGGVSIFAMQLATAAGARVIITSAHEEKLQRALALGGWRTIDTQRDPNWDRRVWEMTEGQGVQHVVETGGPGTLERSMNAVAASGRIHLIGVLTGFGPPTASLFPLLARNVTLHGIYVGSRSHFLELNRFLEAHRLHPVIDRVFQFEEAPQAFDYLASARHVGKVVIALHDD